MAFSTTIYDEDHETYVERLKKYFDVRNLPDNTSTPESATQRVKI